MTTVLDQIGGETALRALVEHFYDLVESMPEGRQIVSLHLQNHGLAHTRVEQFDFLSGFMGGRQYYMEKHRHMNVRDIHAHVPIRLEDAENWLTLMDRALDDLGHEGSHIDRLRATLRRVAMILVNDGKVAGE
ncbi:group II truncated hemoglobin [Aliiroseovarius sp. S1339]|uniref:group II truncated hemoglobin n=1 Tax=Aliiroseovarius sp. S1339 TaxID=2936990 RepID=UPI0020BDA713|nr:group II truncated hemoglobin [Aliiroseovarius sp. S1339]MCK8462250.1 group II truncated hemoglobin [Aliiroseovarius sp. S1339]